MRRTAITVIACLVALATTAAPAFAASNGMLAAAADGKIVTLNPDSSGSGLRTLWTAPAPGDITGLAWSPDGNKLAYSYGGKILIYDLPGAKVSQLANSGTRDVDPAWSASGGQLTYRRITLGVLQETVTVNFDGSPTKTRSLDLAIGEFAWAPDSTPDAPHEAWTVGSLLFVTEMALGLQTDVVGGAAWSADSKWVAYAAKPSITAEGIYAATTGQNNVRFLVAPGKGTAPRWSPDGTALVYLLGGKLQTVPAVENATTTAVSSLTNVTSADWQPCTKGSFADCISVSPPTCPTSVPPVTTQNDRAVNLPVPECTNPGSRGLSYVIVRPPSFGTLTGLSYMPAAGFVGQDEVTYRVSNGFGESEPITVRIFVVKPPTGSQVNPPVSVPTVKGPPYLTARAAPKLDRKRTTLVKLSCDQACSFEVRLTGALKRPKKTLRSTVLKRTLGAGQVLSLRLRLPTKPKGKFKSVYVTGTVRNAAGEKRDVKLPVRLPR